MSRALALQALVATAVAPPIAAQPRLTFGIAAIDARLDGGLAAAALHELFAAAENDHVAAAGFALLLALRGARRGPLVWLRSDRARGDGRLYGLGLAELGCDPDRLMLVEAPDIVAQLRAGAEAVQCPAVATVILEAFGKASAIDLTATRRLALAAARSGVTLLLLRGGVPPPSAATSRWQVAAAPSLPLAANAPGAPAFDISLLRHRSGIAGFDARVEWNRDRGAFATPLPGALPAMAGQRTLAPAARPKAA